MNVKTLTKERSLPQLFQPTLTVFAAAVASLFLTTPSQAFEFVFSSPNVLSGVKDAPFTLPSTGKTSLYNVTLTQGTVGQVYGTPPKFDVDNEADAVAIMDASAQGINAYLANVSPNLSFGVSGNKTFFLPYGTAPAITLFGDTPPGINLGVWSDIVISLSPPFITRVVPRIGSTQPQDNLVYAQVTPVPEPLTMLGSAAAVGFVAALNRRLAKATKEKKNS